MKADLYGEERMKAAKGRKGLLRRTPNYAEQNELKFSRTAGARFTNLTKCLIKRILTIY
jgi:hypothetical protein